MTDEKMERAQQIQRKMKAVRGNLAAIEKTDTEEYMHFGNEGNGCAVPTALRGMMLQMLKAYYEAELEKLQKEYDEL